MGKGVQLRPSRIYMQEECMADATADSLNAAGTGAKWPPRLGRAVALLGFPLSLVSAGATVSMAVTAAIGVGIAVSGKSMGEELRRVLLFMSACYLVLLSVDLLNGGGLANFGSTGVNYLHLIALAPYTLALSALGIRMATIERMLQIAIWLGLANSVVRFFLFGEDRPGGLELNPIPYGFVLTMWGAFLLARGLELGRTKGRFSVMTALAAIVPVVLTQSKIVWACLIVGYAIVVIFIAVRKGQARLIWAGAAVAVPVLFASYYFLGYKRLALFRAELEAYFERGELTEDSFGWRLELVRAALRAVEHKPWLGHGIIERRTAAFAYADPNGPNILPLSHLHNDYLTHLVAFGAPGLVFLLAFCAFIFIVARRAADLGRRAAGYALLVMLMIYMTAEVAFNMDPISGAVTIALGILLLKSPAPDRQTTAKI